MHSVPDSVVAQNTPRQSLRSRVFRSGNWTIIGYGATQLLRFGGNLILTRLLFPEAFGLMAIVQATIIGLHMASDVGLLQSIIQNKRGHEPEFLDTAWTAQIGRGILIWLCLCLVAPLVASFYDEPILVSLLPVVGFSAVIDGCKSTKWAIANRNLALGKITIIDVGSYGAGLIAMIALAWLYPTVWSIAWGGLIGAVLRTLASHLVLDGMRNRLAWHRQSARAQFGFGRWVFVSSLLTFAAGEGNKLLVGAFLDVEMLAFFTLAANISNLSCLAIQTIASSALFPAYSELFRERPERIRSVLARSRLLLILPGCTLGLFFSFFGEEFMSLLYDDRYAQAGSMLRILALGSLAGTVAASYDGVLVAKGTMRAMALMRALQILTQVAAVVAGYHMFGPSGVVAGIAAAFWFMYLLTAYIHAREGLWGPKLDLPLLAIAVPVAMVVLHDVWQM